MLCLILGLFVSTFCFMSCSSDNDENGGGNGSSKRIVKVIEVEGGWTAERSLEYDSQGRVTKITSVELSGGRTVTGIETFSYGETYILSNEEKDNRTETHQYTLSDGLIIKDVEKQSSSTTTLYSYDNTGQIISLSLTGTDTYDDNWNFKWENGNMVEFKNGRAYTYTNLAWPKGFFFYWKGSNMDPEIRMMGFWGRTPTNLPSKYTTTGGTIWLYDYTITDGLVTKMVISNGNTNKELATYTYIWE